jgi:hypothetical protein
MKKLTVSREHADQYLRWIRATVGNAVNLSFMNKEAFIASEKYSMAYQIKYQKISFWFKNDEDATAFRIRFQV